MKRIVIVGAGGSGKSHLARVLGLRLQLPVTHLDAVYFDEHWETMEPAAFADAQEALVAEPAWVIDGNYTSTLSIRLRRADTVVFMDVSTVAAVWGVVSRQLRHGPGQHENAIYNRFNWAVLRYVATYRRRMRPRVIELIGVHAPSTAVVFLRGRRATRAWLRHVHRV